MHLTRKHSTVFWFRILVNRVKEKLKVGFVITTLQLQLMAILIEIPFFFFTIYSYHSTKTV